jgi:hypothetical protein
MNKADRSALITFPVVVLAGFLLALAGSQGGTLVGGIPLFALSVGLAFVLHVSLRDRRRSSFQYQYRCKVNPSVGSGRGLGSSLGRIPVPPDPQGGQG